MKTKRTSFPDVVLQNPFHEGATDGSLCSSKRFPDHSECGGENVGFQPGYTCRPLSIGGRSGDGFGQLQKGKNDGFLGVERLSMGCQ